MDKPTKESVLPKIKEIAEAFKLKGDIDVKFIKLDSSKAWYAARNAAWDAAWDAARDAAYDVARNAAWDAARDAAFIVAEDLIKNEYPKNPFKLLINLCVKGFYVAGFRGNVMTLGWIPKK